MPLKKGWSTWRYDSAAEYARECGLDPSTVIDLVKKGTLKSQRRKKGENYRIPVRGNPFPVRFKKPNPKYNKKYSDTEVYVLLVNKDKGAKVVAKMIGRTEMSVRVKRCRLRKKGYDV